MLKGFLNLLNVNFVVIEGKQWRYVVVLFFAKI